MYHSLINYVNQYLFLILITYRKQWNTNIACFALPLTPWSPSNLNSRKLIYLTAQFSVHPNDPTLSPIQSLWKLFKYQIALLNFIAITVYKFHRVVKSISTKNFFPKITKNMIFAPNIQ